MRNKTLIFTLLSGLALLPGCGKKGTQSTALSGKPVPVSAAAIQYESVQAIFEAPGTVQARDRIALSSQINGFVRSVSIRVGDSVKPGQILATLDARDAENQKAIAQAGVEEAQAALSEARKAYQAAVDRQTAAKASTELANQTFNRYQKLFDARSASPQEMDEMRARRDASVAELASSGSMVAAAQERIKQVESKIAQAKAQSGRADVLLGWTQITAPAAGRIVDRFVDAGSAIFPGTPLMVIESTARPQVLADLPAEHGRRLQTGMMVRLTSSEAPKPLEGRVSEIVPISNTLTHSIQFKVDLPSNSAIPNGQFVRVEVPIGVRNAMLVPRQAVRESGQLTGLFVIDGSSRARFRLVKIASYDADRFEVLSGIEPGERTISKLSDQIVDGIPVETQQ
jgi:multidrug efflux pump subunit AcrA (membrane-fusion protein)